MNILDIVDNEIITEIVGDDLIIHRLHIDENEGVYIIPLAGADEYNTSIIVEENVTCSDDNTNNSFMESFKSAFTIKASIIYPYGIKIVSINSKVIVNNNFRFTYFIEHGIITVRYTKYKSNEECNIK